MLPDINDIYPQDYDNHFIDCDHCSDSITLGTDYYDNGYGYVFCSRACLFNRYKVDGVLKVLKADKEISCLYCKGHEDVYIYADQDFCSPSCFIDFLLDSLFVNKRVAGEDL